MFFSAALIGLVGAAAASPAQVVPNYPHSDLSTGFRLFVNVTDKSLDFKPSVQGLYVTSIHTGAGVNQAGIGALSDNPSIFYQNGTSLEVRNGDSTVITDQGSPLSPYGFSLNKDAGSDTLYTVNINAGAGNRTIGISQFPEGFRFLRPDTYAICNEPIAYYQGKKFNVVKRASGGLGPAGQIETNVPAGCVPVRLVPECATLPDVPAGAWSSHEFAYLSSCYTNVASMNWSQYGP